MKTITIIFLILLSPNLFGAPIQWGGNGHWYDLISKSNLVNTWEFAKNDAASRVFVDPITGESLVGHLATINSIKENSLLRLYWGKEGWLGGYQDPAATSTGSGWNWVTGETWDFTNWSSLEPNDKGTIVAGSDVGVEDGDENALLFWSSGVWNDFSLTNKTSFYYIEYEPVAKVSEPPILLLLLFGAIGLRLVRKSKSR